MSNDSTGPKIVLRDAIPLSVPICVYIDVTNKCNFTCPWCPTGNLLQKKVSKNSGAMSLDLFHKIINGFEDLTKKEGRLVKTLAMYMLGEPFLNGDYLEMLKIAKRSNIAQQVVITTNGSLVDERACDAIIESGVDIVFFSMYGSSNEEYRKVSARYIFDDIISNAARLKKRRQAKGSQTPKIFLKYFVDTDEIRGKKEFLLRYCDDIAFEEPYNMNGAFTRHTGIFINPKPRPKPTLYCSKPWYVMAIVWDGSVLVCCSDWGWNNKVGNVNTDSVEEIWRGDGYHSLRKMIVEGRSGKNPVCMGCNCIKVNDSDANNIDSLIRAFPEKALSRIQHKVCL